VWKGELVCIIGDVGSGKSSLLAAISGQILSFHDNLVRVNGSLALVQQTPWI